jgi:N-methylhydantoinase A/oxoprolinase/acetone carboxylase beta subunit
VELAGFTPTDAAHVLGLQHDGDAEAATRAADLLARARDGSGAAVRPDGKALARLVHDTVVRRSAEAVLDATLRVDGLPPGTIETAIVQRALDRRAALDRGDVWPDGEPATSIRVGPTLHLAGLGAGAPTYHPDAARLLDARCLVPPHAEVANAVGAAVGEIQIRGRATVSQPTRGQYRVHLPDAGPDLGDPEAAVGRAAALLSDRVRAQAERAGAASVDLDVDVARRTATVAGRELFVEATVTVVASGPPRTA